MERTHTNTRFTYVLLAALVLLPAAVLPYPALAAQAGRIDAIEPSCAGVGARVTITGIGFGAKNVMVAVDGVLAQVVAATGHSATFIVPAGVQLGPTMVTATNPGGHLGNIAFQVCDLRVPDPWAGEWKMTITSRKAATGNVTSIRKVTAFLRTGEPFGMGVVVAKLASCTGAIMDTELEVHCTTQLTRAGCAVNGDVQVAATRMGETISGTGASTLDVTGDCGPLVSSAETIEISGQRLSLDQGNPGATTTLLLSFVPHASLLSRLP